MSEPSAWAKAVMDRLENECGDTCDFVVCAEHGSLALDAAWRAGAAAMRARILAHFVLNIPSGQLVSVTGSAYIDGPFQDLGSIPLPDPGEER